MNDLENLDFRKHVVSLWKRHPLWNAVDISKRVHSNSSDIRKVLEEEFSQEELEQRNVNRGNARFLQSVRDYADVAVAGFYDSCLSSKEIAAKHKTTVKVINTIWERHFRSRELSERLENAQVAAMKIHMALTSEEKKKLRDTAKLTKDSNGYYLMPKPFWVTGRVNSEHIFVHQVVLMESLGITAIPEGFVVHHINENIHDNELTNLALMTMAAHRRQHQVMRDCCAKTR